MSSVPRRKDVQERPSLQEQLRRNDELFKDTGSLFGLKKLARKQADPGMYEAVWAILLNICNTGRSDLIVNNITSSDPQFTVLRTTFPLVVSPDSCFPVSVRFTPTTAGAKSSTLTITSNDPVTPSLTVSAICS